MKRNGFSLIECVTGMALSLFVVCASLEFFVFSEKLFFKLKTNEETGQAVLAALDKMRIDLHHAGRGLVPALRFGLVQAVEISGDALILNRAERTYGLADDIEAGDERLLLASVSGLRPGREICLWDDSKGEVREITAVETATRSIVLEAPFNSGYGRESTAVVLLETTALFLDPEQGTLRRRVNLSSAQPLLDNVSSADFRFDPQRNLAVVRLEIPSQGARAYEISVFPKNSGAATR